LSKEAPVTPEDLIRQVRGLYLKQKKRKNPVPGIYRGTSPSISAEAEDLFARYIREALPDSGFEIWVDPQISCPPKGKTGRRKMFRPDICVVRKETVVMIFELKLDLSFQRASFAADAAKKAKELEELAGTEVRCSMNGERRIAFAAGLKWNFVVISGTYISGPKMQAIKERFAAEDSPGSLFVLSCKVHPGEGVPELNHEAFDGLAKKVNALKSAKRSGI
jgi:hypothetical protein